jgi:ABC-type sugar transport system ATPase subunit
MNFLPAQVRRNGRSAQTFVGNREVALPQLTDILVENDTRVFLGIRPHHLRLCGSDEAATEGWGHLADGTVECVENLGDSTNVHVLTDEGERLNVKSAERTNLSAGARVRVILDIQKAFLFRDGMSSERLS